MRAMREMGRRDFIGAAAALAFGAVRAQPGQHWTPPETVTLVVPFGPGAAVDVVARMLADALTHMWGRTVIVENRPGANGIIGTAHVTRAKPDGLTLLVAHSALTVDPFLVKDLSYVAERDLVPVAPVGFTYLMLFVKPGLAANNLKEFEKLSKKPGGLSFAVPDGNTRLWATRLGQSFGVQFDQVPYKGSNALLVDMMGGHVDAGFAGISSGISQLRANKVRALAVIAPNRQPQIPEIPTFAEQGVAGFTSPVWFSIFAPSKVPQSVVAQINQDIREVMSRADFRRKVDESGMTPNDETLAQFATRIQRERVENAAIVQRAGIIPE